MAEQWELRLMRWPTVASETETKQAKCYLQMVGHPKMTPHATEDGAEAEANARLDRLAEMAPAVEWRAVWSCGSQRREARRAARDEHTGDSG